MRIPAFYGYLLLTMVYGAGHVTFHVRNMSDLSNWVKFGCACLGFWTAPVMWPVMLIDDLEALHVASMRIPAFYGYLLLTMVYGGGHSLWNMRHISDLSHWGKIGCACLGFWTGPVMWPVMLAYDLSEMRKKLMKRD